MEDASHDITRFDAELGGEVAPFAAVLLRSESAASSRIENLTASARSIAEAELPGGKGKANAELIVANTAAMTAAVALSDTVDAAAILTMHVALMGGQPRHTPGQWRTEQVWIGGGNSPLSAQFVPPSHTRVPAAIDDLMTFAARDDVPLLAQIAVAHAQFETIHPFTDGNGRTGRALVQAMLRNKGLTRQVTVPVSAGLLADDRRIHRRAHRVPQGRRHTHRRAVRRGECSSHRQRSAAGHRTARMRESWNDTITARADSAVWKVADLLTRRPVVNAVLVRDELGPEQITHAATSVRSSKQGSSLSSPTGHATVPGVHPRCSPRSTRSPSGPDDEVDGWSRSADQLRTTSDRYDMQLTQFSTSVPCKAI